jgi:hypothetical protein
MKQTPWSVEGIAHIDPTITGHHLNSSINAVDLSLNEIVDAWQFEMSSNVARDVAHDVARDAAQDAARDDAGAKDVGAHDVADVLETETVSSSPFSFGPGRWRSGQVSPKASKASKAIPPKPAATPGNKPTATPDMPPKTVNLTDTSSHREGVSADVTREFLSEWQWVLQEVEKNKLEQARLRKIMIARISRLHQQMTGLQKDVAAVQKQLGGISEDLDEMPPRHSILAIEQGVVTTGRALMRLATRIDTLEQQRNLPMQFYHRLKHFVIAIIPKWPERPGSARR